MKDNKGQALVEFIIIMPVFIMLALSVLDFGSIMHAKYELGNDLDHIVDLYKDKDFNEIEKYTDSKKINASYVSEGKYVSVSVNKTVKIITPGLNKVLGNNYKIDSQRYIYE